MSVLVPETAAPPAVRTTWAHVGPNLWVASTVGPSGGAEFVGTEFVGTVERIGARFVACDRVALEIATCPDLETAKAAVVGSWSPDVVGARGRSTPRLEMPIAWATAMVAGLAAIGSLVWIAWGV